MNRRSKIYKYGPKQDGNFYFDWYFEELDFGKTGAASFPALKRQLKISKKKNNKKKKTIIENSINRE